MHELSELKIGHKAIDLTAEIYKAAASFPKTEIYGLYPSPDKAVGSFYSVKHSRRSGRNTSNDFKHFLSITNGSSYAL